MRPCGKGEAAAEAFGRYAQRLAEHSPVLPAKRSLVWVRTEEGVITVWFLLLGSANRCNLETDCLLPRYRSNLLANGVARISMLDGEFARISFSFCLTKKMRFPKRTFQEKQLFSPSFLLIETMTGKNLTSKAGWWNVTTGRECRRR